MFNTQAPLENKTELFAFKAIGRTRSKGQHFGGWDHWGNSCELGFHEFFENIGAQQFRDPNKQYGQMDVFHIKVAAPFNYRIKSCIDGRTRPPCIWLFLFQLAKSMSGSSWFIHFTVALMMSPTAAKARRQISFGTQAEITRMAPGRTQRHPHDSTTTAVSKVRKAWLLKLFWSHNLSERNPNLQIRRQNSIGHK